jgi:hypothetical protein
MKHLDAKSLVTAPPAKAYGFTSLLGGLISNSSLFMLILCFSFAVAAAAVETAKTVWHHPDFRSFVAALEADLADTDSSASDLNAQPAVLFKDPVKAQKDENRARRKLAKELRQRKASASNLKPVLQRDRRS